MSYQTFTVQKVALAILFHELDNHHQRPPNCATDCNVGHMPTMARLSRWETALTVSATDPNDYQKA
jgi:hypothetical protein